MPNAHSLRSHNRSLSRLSIVISLQGSEKNGLRDTVTISAISSKAAALASLALLSRHQTNQTKKGWHFAACCCAHRSCCGSSPDVRPASATGGARHTQLCRLRPRWEVQPATSALAGTTPDHPPHRQRSMACLANTRRCRRAITGKQRGATQVQSFLCPQRIIKRFQAPARPGKHTRQRTIVFASETWRQFNVHPIAMAVTNC